MSNENYGNNNPIVYICLSVVSVLVTVFFGYGVILVRVFWLKK